MSTSETITKTDLKNILEAAGNIGQVDSTPTPTAGKVSEFDAAANINSTDMSANELTSFLENLDPHGSGGESGTPIPTANTTAAFDSNANMNSSDMTTAQVDTLVGNITAAGGSLIDFFYPVGSYYETSDTTFNPNIRWGGTWVLETEGQVHISGSANGTYQVEGALTNTTDGGEETHTLTDDELPAISAYFSIHGQEGGTIFYQKNGTHSTGTQMSNNYQTTNTTTNAKTGAHSWQNPGIAFGSDDAHNNMQPYIVVNRWHRTA